MAKVLDQEQILSNFQASNWSKRPVENIIWKSFRRSKIKRWNSRFYTFLMGNSDLVALISIPPDPPGLSHGKDGHQGHQDGRHHLDHLRLRSLRQERSSATAFFLLAGRRTCSTTVQDWPRSGSLSNYILGDVNSSSKWGGEPDWADPSQALSNEILGDVT